MAERIIEVYVPAGQGWDVSQVLADAPVLETWRRDGNAETTLTRLLVDERHTEAVLHRLEDRFEDTEGFRAVVLPVEATTPRITDAQHEATQPSDEEATSRISIQELHSDLWDMSKLTRVYLLLVALATIVAAIGLIRDNVAVVIGSMVIAPLLGPSMAFALSITLADVRLAWEATKAQAAGVGLSLALSVGLGALFPVDASIPEIALRTQPTLWDVGLGLAVGAAGVLSVTTGVSTALVGVMVAVALVPPLVAAGLLAGAGLWGPAIGAAVLLAVYVISINLSGVAVFALQGVRPRRYWEADRAKRASIAVAVLWVALLALLAGAILAHRHGLLTL